MKLRSVLLGLASGLTVCVAAGTDGARQVHSSQNQVEPMRSITSEQKGIQRNHTHMHGKNCRHKAVQYGDQIDNVHEERYRSFHGSPLDPYGLRSYEPMEQ